MEFLQGWTAFGSRAAGGRRRIAAATAAAVSGRPTKTIRLSPALGPRVVPKRLQAPLHRAGEVPPSKGKCPLTIS